MAGFLLTISLCISIGATAQATTSPGQTPKPADQQKPTLEKTADGSTIAKFPNGPTIEKNEAAGTTKTTLPDGSIVEDNSRTSTTTLTTPGGMQISREGNGDITVHVKGLAPQTFKAPKSGDTKVYESETGVKVEFTGVAGSSVVTFTDGDRATKAIMMPLGVTLRPPNAADGTGTFVDGRGKVVEQQIKPNGDADGTTYASDGQRTDYEITKAGRVEKQVTTPEGRPEKKESDKGFKSIVGDLFPSEQKPAPDQKPKTDSSFDAHEWDVDVMAAVGGAKGTQQSVQQVFDAQRNQFINVVTPASSLGGSVAGAGGGVAYFLSRTAGVAARAEWLTSNGNLGLIEGLATVRFPSGDNALYVYGGAGVQFVGRTAALGLVGGGFEHRFAPGRAVWIEGAGIFGADASGGLIRGGLRVTIRR